MGNVAVRWNAIGSLVGWFVIGLNLSAKYLHRSPTVLSPIRLGLSPERKKSNIVIFCLGLVRYFFCYREG